MDYNFLSEKSSCDCNNQFILGGIVTLFLMTIVDCVYGSKTESRIQELNSENKTLKNIIRTSLDRTIVSLLKNGNDPEYSDEE